MIDLETIERGSRSYLLDSGRVWGLGLMVHLMHDATLLPNES
jgi:hypothetical protein